MTRSVDLPDYKAPPLIEVLLGVQFDSPPTFSAVDVRLVWDLFRKEFPVSQDIMSIQPRFETFGGASFNQAFMPQFINLQAPGWNGRVRFISEDNNHILQFQSGQFVASWLGEDGKQPYPRFEKIIEKFECNLSALFTFYKDKFNLPLSINQAEVTYVNIIKVAAISEIGDFFVGYGRSHDDTEAFNSNHSVIVKDAQQQPYARLYQELQSVVARDGVQKAFKLSLTFRGKPSGTSIPDVKAFLLSGRKAIVDKFTETTTEAAHELWERQV